MNNKTINNDELNFFASSYLECISNNDRKEAVNTLGMSLNEFIEIIKFAKYDDILNYMLELTHSDMIIMFQSKGGQAISSHCTYNDVIILAESQTPESKNRTVPILRSELLSFYCDNSMNPKCGKILLELKDSLKIVKIYEHQVDSIVKEYYRVPCTIVFIELGYSSRKGIENTNKIYLAFFYKYENDIINMLSNLKYFFSFRYAFMERISKDFERNLFGIQKEQDWRNRWLSIEKAGSHADSKFIDEIIKNSNFESKGLSEIFFDNNEEGTDNLSNKRNSLQLIANIIIARYFRLIFSPSQSNWSCYEHIQLNSNNRYYYLEDILNIDKTHFEISYNGKKLQVEFPNYKKNSIRIYYKKSKSGDKFFSGIPCENKITYSRKYLQAFLIDIFYNITKYGDKIRISTEMSTNDMPDFLVIKNTVSQKEITDCLVSNYDLKQSIEFENANNPSIKKGISLGCINHFMNYFGNMNAYYEGVDGDIWFSLKLPIIGNNN